ncbi:MAG: GDP-L-fucose synthase [Patescibacteria group bacterium]
MNLKDKKILVTGGQGFLGARLVKNLVEKRKVPLRNIKAPRFSDCDLRLMESCKVATSGIDVIIHLAARAGGIGLNREKPGELFYDNLIMGTHIMEAARQAGVQKFVGIATICAYPKFTPVPFKEENLWNGYPEETNAPYGLAKKMLLVQAQAYREQYDFNAITLFPVNMYGPGDNFEERSSHVIPALIRKIAVAKKQNKDYIEVWGTGTPTREFLYVEEAAEGIILAAEKYDKPDPVNLGAGTEISIRALVDLVCRIMNYRGEVKWDKSKPDGQPRRILDATRAEREFGFKSQTPFEDGLKSTIDWFERTIAYD